MLVSRDTIKGLSPVAEGYKIFNNNWTADQGGYDFKDPATGEAVGTVHQADGEIICCERCCFLERGGMSYQYTGRRRNDGCCYGEKVNKKDCKSLRKEANHETN